jgi:hypothetical protein
VTMTEAIQLLGVSRPAASRHLQHLVDAGHGRPAVCRQQVIDVPTRTRPESLSPRIRARGRDEVVQLAGLRQMAGLRANARVARTVLTPDRRSSRARNGEWSRHSDLNRGPAVYEVDRPERCGTSVESRA